MKKVLVLSFSNLSSDTRVRRQLAVLKESFDVVAVGNDDPAIEGVTFLPSGFAPKTVSERVAIYSNQFLGRYLAAYWRPKWMRRLKERLAGEKYDAVIANDTDALPMAFTLGCPVLFDSHEYAPREFEDSFWWRLIYQKYRTWLCREYAPRAAHCITVAPGIAEEFKQQMNVAFTVVTNASYYQRLSPKKTARDTIHLVSHGLAHPSRRLEELVQVMRHTDARYHLHLYLVGGEAYIETLERMAAEMANITFHAPVAATELCSMLNQYDMGLFLLQGQNFNYVHALPNKFFEFMQARLAIAIGPSVEMAPYVREYDCGVVADTFAPQDMAARLNALTAEEIDAFKQNTDKLAKVACAEKNAEVLLSLVGGMVNTNGGGRANNAAAE